VSYPNPFLAAQDWNDTTRKAKYDSGTPHGQPNPYLTGINPATGKAPYGITVASPHAARFAGFDKVRWP
jgi:hypothetical protein